mmetsp:Transcript_18789/g.30370  ORF Transcript_18789/g.30370 Transcript_18789/m.30370 type:complete len:140 (+) Transcript_18789:86-505(+)
MRSILPGGNDDKKDLRSRQHQRQHLPHVPWKYSPRSSYRTFEADGTETVSWYAHPTSYDDAYAKKCTNITRPSSIPIWKTCQIYLRGWEELDHVVVRRACIVPLLATTCTTKVGECVVEIRGVGGMSSFHFVAVVRQLV